MAQIEYISVLSLSNCKDEAMLISQKIIENKLAATIQVIKTDSTIYYWDGQLCDDKQYLIMAQTHRDKFEEIKDLIESINSFEVPMVIALPILAANDDFMHWVKDSIS
ncbi:divalent-cation tolerance protein CutA [bacterium]|nr:divalent-cation tolerance protein CutA [bacterium]